MGVPKGGPVDLNQAAFAVALPQTVFSSVILCPMCITGEQRATFHFAVTLLIPQYLTYAVCVCLQVALVVYMRNIVSAGHAEAEPGEFCAGGDHTCLLICTLVCIASFYKDLLETAYMSFWLSLLPQWDHEKHNHIVEEACRTSGLTDFPFQKYVSNEDPIELTKPAVGITWHYRVFVHVLLLPKLLIAIALVIYGAAFVASGENNEGMILNAVANVFILEIDDLVFGLLTPAMYKLWIESCGTITLCEDEVGEWQLYLPYLGILCLGLGTFGVINAWC